MGHVLDFPPAKIYSPVREEWWMRGEVERQRSMLSVVDAEHCVPEVRESRDGAPPAGVGLTRTSPRRLARGARRRPGPRGRRGRSPRPRAAPADATPLRSRGLAGSGGSLHRQAPGVHEVYGRSWAAPGRETAPGPGRSPVLSTDVVKVGGTQKMLTSVEA